MSLDVLLGKYEEKFGDMFPTMCFQDDSQQELAEKIQECLDKQTSAEVLFEIDNLYIY